MYYYKIYVIIFVALLAAACGKEKPMYGNPKGIIIYKDGESLTDLSKRIIGARIDSLGLPLNDGLYKVYESGPFLIMGIFDQPGNPIYQVELKDCNIDKKIALGSLFGEYGCNKESLKRLGSMGLGSNSHIKLMCGREEGEEVMKVQGYADTEKEIYWTISGNDIVSAGVYKGSRTGLMPCDKVLRAIDKSKEAKKDQFAKWRYGSPGGFLVSGKEYSFEDVKIEGNSMLDEQGNNLVTAYAYISTTELPNDPFGIIQTHISGGEIHGTGVYTDTNNWINLVVNPQDLIRENFTQEDFKGMKRVISRAQGNKALVRIKGRFNLFGNTGALYFDAQIIEIVDLNKN